MKKLISTLSVVALVIGACGQGEEVFSARKAPAPVYAEKADGSGDSADTSCLVVLRSVRNIPRTTSCSLNLPTSDGRCHYVWEGFVDVDASRIPAGVEVLYRINYDDNWDGIDDRQGEWFAVAASAIGEGESGFERYRFLIYENTPVDGQSVTGMSRTVIELIPYAVTPSGGRIFDHNRIADPMGNYRLLKANDWTISEDEHCRTLSNSDIPEYRFLYPWKQYVVGKPQAGGKVKIIYDTERIWYAGGYGCFGSIGKPITNIYVGWKFDSSSDVGQAIVAAPSCIEGLDNCINGGYYQPVIDIPYNARRAEFWFYCYAPNIGGNVYDSNYGKNFSLDIEPAATSWPSDFWAGNFLVNISRGATDPCEGGAQYNGSFTYDSWASTRATVRNFCFDVWKQGVTDWDNPDIWKQLDVQVHYYFEGEQQMRTAYVNMVYRTGNNARYALDLGGFNPFAIYHCPDVPYTTFEQNGLEYWRADYYFYFTVNGYEVRPEGPNSFFHGIYIGENTPWHAENCR